MAGIERKVKEQRKPLRARRKARGQDCQKARTQTKQGSMMTCHKCGVELEPGLPDHSLNGSVAYDCRGDAGFHRAAKKLGRTILETAIGMTPSREDDEHGN
jgi:hypothetical protein